MRNKSFFYLLALLLFIASQANCFAENKKMDVLVSPLLPPQILNTEEVFVNPPAPYAQEAKRPSESKGIFGLQKNTEISGFYMLNKSGQKGIFGTAGINYAIVYEDPLLLSKNIGLAEDALQYKIGSGLYYGKDLGDNDIFSIPLSFDGVLYLKEKSFYGFDPFLSAGFNFNIIGTGGKVGGLGLKFAAGILIDTKIKSGKTGLSIGYGGINVLHSRYSEGFMFSISQPIIL